MNRAYRWWRIGTWSALGIIAALGCNPLATIAFLTHRDVPVPARYPLFPKDGPKKDKVVVAIFVNPGVSLGYEFAGAEDVVASELAKKMPEMAKENKKNLEVVPPAKVNEFKRKNPNWKNGMSPIAWGKALGADYVLDIHLMKMSLFQPGSQNQLYEGRAEVHVFLYDVNAGGAPEHYVHPFAFPKTGFRDASSIPVGTFRKAFLERLAVEIAQYHLDYRADSGIAETRW
ncbi:MAG: hypothetical protein NZU63_08950 [Gemmataceae bacterium]|nr:hypothetical protein [Gemmataceae bacterium]MDW8244312.1 hypothetical protein [Thermogemmata sp.]